MATDKGQATDETVVAPAYDEEFDKKFGFARELAEKNHEADVKRTEDRQVEEDENAKVEIPAQPQLHEAKNPEQVETDPSVETNTSEPTGTGTGEGEVVSPTKATPTKKAK